MERVMLLSLATILSWSSFCYAGVKLENLIGKTIYRDVPAKNKTEYDTAYQNTPYTIDSYNENIVSLRNKNGNLIILNKTLWDDGNWKEWIEVKTTKLDKLIGRFIHRNDFKCPINLSELGIDFINEKWLLIDVGNKTFTIHKNSVDGQKFKLDREFWDDGNWEEYIKLPKYNPEEETLYYMSWEAWNEIKETSQMSEANRPSSIVYHSTLDLKQWDHVHINVHSHKINATWLECGQILMFYNVDNESCFNHAVIRLCNEHKSKYHRDVIAYQKVCWLKKEGKCLQSH